MATQISLVRTMKGATDSDRRESSVPKVKELSDTHLGAPGLARCAWHPQVLHSSETCSRVTLAVLCPVGQPIDLGSLISTMGGPIGIGLPMVIELRAFSGPPIATRSGRRQPLLDEAEDARLR